MLASGLPGDADLPQPSVSAALTLLRQSLGLRFVSFETRVGARCWVSGDPAHQSLPLVRHSLKQGTLCADADIEPKQLEPWGLVLDGLVSFEGALRPVSDVTRSVVEELSVPAAVAVGERLHLNAAGERLLGYSRAQLSTIDGYFQTLFGDDALTMRAMHAVDLQAGATSRLVSFRSGSGVERMVELTVRPMTGCEVWFFADVTARVASQERFSVLFEQSSTALALYDEMGFLDCNPAAVALLGYPSRRELLATTPLSLSLPQLDDGRPTKETLQRLESIALTSGTNRFDWVYVRKDGSRAEVEVTLTPLALDDRRVLLAEWHDISERLRYEEGLEDARDAALAFARARADFLATMSHEIRTPMNGVIGMTRLLAETPLTAQQRDYVETVRACGEGLVALINDILDFSRLEAGKVTLEHIAYPLRELCEDTALVVAPQAHQKGLELCVRLAPNVPDAALGDPTRLRQVLLNLLSNAVKFTATGTVSLTAESARSEEGAPELVLSVSDTGIGIAPEVLPKLFSAFTQADSSTTRRFGGSGLGLAICKHLTQLMGGRLEAASGPAGSTFTVRVPLEVHRPHVFLPRYQGRTALVLDERPVSRAVLEQKLEMLGFSLVADEGRAEVVLVEQRHARLAAVLERGAAAGQVVGVVTYFAEGGTVPAGASMVLSHPLRERALERELDSALAGKKTAQFEPPTRAVLGARVLVAEDNAINQRVVRGLLGRLGCVVTVAPDGQAAVEAHAGGGFDLILMDCQMPVVDGLEATRRIRRVDAAIPIVALTAGVLDGDRERCLQAGMNEFLCKPIRLEDLERTLVAHLTPRPRLQLESGAVGVVGAVSSA